MGILVKRGVADIARANLPVCVFSEDSDEVAIATDRIGLAGFPVMGTDSPWEVLRQVRTGACRAVLADCKTPEAGELSFLDEVLQCNPESHVILVAESYSAESAIEAIRGGAYDYLFKPLNFSQLTRRLDELAEYFRVRTAARALEDKLLETSQFEGMVGKSPAIVAVFELAKRISRHYTEILITGPAGAGKNLIARALHLCGPVAEGPFVVCNCGSYPDSLLESKGIAEKWRGLFESAIGGTLFLRQISEMPLLTQEQLLRAVEKRDIRTTGCGDGKRVDVRIIASTSRDLLTEVSGGRFREELFRRLSKVEMCVPGLSERAEDIPMLARVFLERCGRVMEKHFQGFTRRAQSALLQHGWPSNVRELENAVEYAATNARAEWIDVANLPKAVQESHVRPLPAAEDWRPAPLAEMRGVHIQRVLEACEGNRVRAARILGIGRTSLYRFLKRSGKQTAEVGAGS